MSVKASHTKMAIASICRALERSSRIHPCDHPGNAVAACEALRMRRRPGYYEPTSETLDQILRFKRCEAALPQEDS